MMIRNQPTIISVPLRLPTGEFAVDPPVVAGDVLISLDGGAFIPVDAVPSVVTGTAIARVALTAAETNADTVDLILTDPDGVWDQVYVTERTTQPAPTASSISARIASDQEQEMNGWDDTLQLNALRYAIQASNTISTRWNAGSDQWPAVNSVISASTEAALLNDMDVSAFLAAVSSNIEAAINNEADGTMTIATLATALAIPTSASISARIASDQEQELNGWGDALELNALRCALQTSDTLSMRWNTGLDNWPAVNGVISAQIAGDVSNGNNSWDDGVDAIASVTTDQIDFPANFSDLLITTTGLVSTGGSGGSGSTVDLNQVLAAIDDIPTINLERAGGPIDTLVADVSQIKKYGDTVLVTRIASEQGVSDTVIETRG